MIFSGSTIDECISKASEKLNINRNEIRYKIHNMDKNEDGLNIQIEVLDNYTDSKVINSEFEKISLQECNKEETEIISESGILIKVNDKIFKGNVKVKKSDNIFIAKEKQNPKREMSIKVSKDRMLAELTVNYHNEKKKQIVKDIKDNIVRLSLIDTDEIIRPERFTKIDVHRKIKESNIIYGIDLTSINKVIEFNDDNLTVCIAKGIEAVNDKDDTVNVLFGKHIDTISENERIDYRNKNLIQNVQAGDIIGEIIIGKIGTDGKDVYGDIVNRKEKRKLKIKCKDGCILKENKILALKDGRADFKKNTFTVYSLLEFHSDIDLKTGNVNFVGSVSIEGNVSTGMSVKAGNSVSILGSVESASIISNGELSIKGNILSSNILVGSDDEELLKYIEILKKLQEDLENIKVVAEQIKRSRKLGDNVKYGNIIKLVIEQKFNSIQRTALQVVAYHSTFDRECDIANILRKKIVGLGPLSIESDKEFLEIIDKVEQEIKEVEKETVIPVDAEISYAQDTKINSTGDVLITGKGQYVSNIKAGRDIVFLDKNSVCRGGEITAGRNIKAMIVGSPAGVSTILKVPSDGVITADAVYHNTVLQIGKRKITLDAASKFVKAYLGKDNQITVEKINL